MGSFAGRRSAAAGGRIRRGSVPPTARGRAERLRALTVRRAARVLGTVLIVGGLLGIGWVLLVWQWQDPFTALYTKYEQHKLASSYEHRLTNYRPPARASTASPPSAGRAGAIRAERRRIAIDARAYRRSLHDGDPVGRLIVPRLGLNAIVVNGTSHDDLTRGPGRELHTFMPGENELVYIAGHRTTYGAPFAHCDLLLAGDPVTLEVPYATFHYRITGHRIVTAHDLSVLRSHRHELLALQACHPRFFATHRYIAYAKLVRVVPHDGKPYTLNPSGTSS